MQIENHLLHSVRTALEAIFGINPDTALIQLQKTKKEFEGDYTLVVFPLLRLTGGKPPETADKIGQYLLNNDPMITGYNTVQGFLNLSIDDQYFTQAFAEILENDRFGQQSASGKKIMVEYSSPNTNKPLHLGHLRNNFLGYSVSRILEACGHEVIKVQIINDRGIHICKSMVAWLHFGNGETPESSGLKGDKLVGKYYVAFDQAYKKQIQELQAQGHSEDDAAKLAPMMIEAREMLLKWEAKDAEVYALWEKMNNWVYTGFAQTYKAMGVTFDKLYYESDTYLTGKKAVELGIEKGVFYRRDDHSVWCDLREEGLDEKLVLRSDGTAVYITQDIGTAMLRFEDYPGLDYQIYTVGNEQEYHFKVLFLMLKKLGFNKSADNFHLSYGMVELPEGKMKSREGTVVDADDLMAEMESTAAEIAEEQGKLEGLSEEEKNHLHHIIGTGALKYYLLKVDPKKNMMFNPAESIDFNGHTGPFIQYGYVRTRAILRKFNQEIKRNNWPETLSPEEKSLIVKLLDYPSEVETAGKTYNPAGLANYIFELVKTFNSFYQSNPILREENEMLKNFRVALSAKTGEVVKASMALLGIEMPERM